MSNRRSHLIISDTQAPFQHPDAIDFLVAIADVIKPSEIYHIGDEVDHHAMSEYVKHPNAPGAQDEYEQASVWLDDLEQAFPKMRLCYSNHTGRLFKAAARAGISSAFVRPPHEVYNKPKWRWANGWDVAWAKGTVHIYHGQKKRGAFNRAKMLGSSVISGHSHTLCGVQWYLADTNLVFGMDVGSLLNKAAPNMHYAEQNALSEILSTGALVSGWPEIFHMDTDKNGRWTRRIV